MAAGKILYHFWSLPEIRGLDLDSPNTVIIHRRILESKAALKQVYDHWYNELVSALEGTSALAHLPIVELGCGASFLERYIPNVIKTDVVAHANAAQVADAEKLPFADRSLRGIVMVGVFHHIENPACFLNEAIRCLVPGGRIVLVEPSNSPLHRLMIKQFHPFEFFDSSITDWKNGTTGRLSNANNALPWVVFCRDKERFEKTFPELLIEKIHYHTFILFYLSGGFSYRAFVSEKLLPLLTKVERLLERLFPSLGTMMTIQVRKV